MAFHVSKLTLRLPKPISFGLRPGSGTKHPCIDLKFTKITSATSRRSLHSVFCQASESWSAYSRLLKPKSGNHRWAVSTAKRLENFSSASTASKSFHLKSVSAPNRKSWSRSYTVALSVLGVSTGVIAALHTSALLAMSAETVNLESDRTDWQEAKRESGVETKFALRSLYSMTVIDNCLGQLCSQNNNKLNSLKVLLLLVISK